MLVTPAAHALARCPLRFAEVAALDFVGLAPGTHNADLRPDTVSVGPCPDARIEDLRAAAAAGGLSSCRAAGCPAP